MHLPFGLLNYSNTYIATQHIRSLIPADTFLIGNRKIIVVRLYYNVRSLLFSEAYFACSETDHGNWQGE